MIKSTHELTVYETELQDIMYDCIGDDDFYTDGELLSSDMLVMFIQENYDYFFKVARVEEVAEFVTNWVNRDKKQEN